MVLTLHTFPTPVTRKVAIALEELGLEYNLKVVNVFKGEHLTAEYEAINQFRKVPALEDDNGPAGPLKLSDTTAILLYLAKNYDPENKLSFQENTEEHWSLVRWISHITSTMQATVMAAFFFKYIAPLFNYPQNPEAIKALTDSGVKALTVIENHLAKQSAENEGPWLVGNKYTLADIALFSYFRSLAAIDVTLAPEKFPALLKWGEKIAARTAVQKGVTVAEQ